MPFYDRKTPRLRLGRTSSSGANYFITLCTKNRVPCLTQKDTSMRVVGTLLAMHDSRDVGLIAATVMPDHVHLLFSLGDRLELGQVMGKFKTKSRNQGRVAWHWQEDGFEHRVRNEEMVEDYGFYIFMNPYHAGLCSLERRWEWWLCPIPSNLRFLSHLPSGESVPHEWLGLSTQIEARISIGD